MILNTDLGNDIGVFQVLVDPKRFGGKMKLAVASNKANKVDTSLFQGDPLFEVDSPIIADVGKPLSAYLVRGFMGKGTI